MDPFKSQVDGSIITSEKELREHNKRNSVRNYHEYDEAHWEMGRKRKYEETDPSSKTNCRQRRKEIHKNIHRSQTNNMKRK